jgi:DNA-binding transcriptional ArsR family regulator
MDILKELAICDELTIDQLQRILRLSPTSLPYLRSHLRALKKEGYVETAVPAKQILLGRAPNVHSLGAAGRTILKNTGNPVPGRYRSLKERLHSQYPIRHRLATNEVLIDARLLPTEVHDVLLKDYRTEKQLNANPLKVTIPGREKLYRLSPDLWLFFSHKSWDFFCCVEVNLSEVSQREWRERIRAYLYSLSAYRERFGINAMVVLTIIQSQIDFPKTTPKELTLQIYKDLGDAKADRQKRLNNLVKWTAAELTALGVEQYADMFWFTDIRLHDTTPRELFYGAHWKIPFRETYAAPLPPGKGADGS